MTDRLTNAPATPRDEGGGGLVLSPSATTRVRGIARVHRDPRLLANQVEHAARQTADDARSVGATAEHMIVALKRTWGESDEIRAVPPTIARQLLERLVTSSIRAYYRTGDP